jgi:UPF0755 protein
MFLFSFIRTAWEMADLHVMRSPRAHVALVALIIGFGILSWAFLIPTAAFPSKTIITIPEGASVAEAATLLEQEHVIPSSLAFRILARITGKDASINSGRYLFDAPVGAGTVFARLVSGDSGIPVVRITFPEGMTAREMGELLSSKLIAFDADEWARETAALEGYLFPDTYNFPEDATPSDVIQKMTGTFSARTEELRKEAAAEGKDWNDIVTMASIVEREANTAGDRRIVAGILWSRIEAKVALQVDATFGYIRGISGYVPTGDDPEELDSPYNTYQHRGLPPGAISNPGLDALTAAVHPTKTDYFYYLTGEDGKMHYAKTFEEHKRNQQLYL